MTDAEHIAFHLLTLAGVEKPTQQQLQDVTLQWLQHTKAQRAQIKFLEQKAAELERENFALAAHQCTDGRAMPNGDWRCCCHFNLTQTAPISVIRAAELLNNWNVTMAQAEHPTDKFYRSHMNPAARKLDEAFQAYFAAQLPATCAACGGTGIEEMRVAAADKIDIPCRACGVN